jgi:hypothetical protein
MIYITKDVNETLDYVFIRNVEDNIVSVNYTQDNLGGLVVDNCTTNSGDVVLDDGTIYPAGRAIVLWVSGGTVGGKEKVILTYTTAAGRVRDEAIIFTLVQEN